MRKVEGKSTAKISDPEAAGLPPSEYYVLFVNVGGAVTCHIRMGDGLHSDSIHAHKQTAQLELNMYTMHSVKGQYVEYARALCRAEKLEAAAKALLRAQTAGDEEAIKNAKRELYIATFQPVTVVERYYDKTELQPKWTKINGELQPKQSGGNHETKGPGS